MIEKIIRRDAEGRIASIIERPLDLEEQLVELHYRRIMEVAQRQAAPRSDAPQVIISVPLVAGAAPPRVFALLAERLKADADLWERTGWGGITLRRLIVEEA